MKTKEIELINMLPLEERAKEQEKSPSCTIPCVLFLVGLGLGLYYWFYDEIVFVYYDVSPFWGFILLTSFGIIASGIYLWVFYSYWSEYNEVITKANKEIEDIIKRGDCDPTTLLRLKKYLIERKLEKSIGLTQEEFLWHTSRYCWGCGKVQSDRAIPYIVNRERTESWKDGAVRYTKTFKSSGTINICPECYERLLKTDEKNTEVASYYIIIMIVLGIGICFGSYCIWDNNGIYVSIAIILLGGYNILIFLTHLLLLPFKKKLGIDKTKWPFDEIPDIKHFMNRNLPHTH